MRTPRLAPLAALALAVALGAPAAAEEAKTPISASMLLDLVSTPLEPRAAAFDRSLREDGPAPAAPAGRVQPDGSVRYGPATVSVTVKNPCPPGTLHYEPPPLPGRRARN